MKALIGIVAPTSTRLFMQFIAQYQGSTQVVASTTVAVAYSLFVTSSVAYVEAFTSSYTVDKHGSITVNSIYFAMVTNNDANAQCKIQVSGDGGSTWVDVTGDVGSGVDIPTSSAGLWINSINIGDNQLKIRVLIKSTNGAAATTRIKQDAAMRFVINKKFV